MTQLEEQLGVDVFQETCDALAARVFEIEPPDYGDHFVGRQVTCPECGSDALLMGNLEVDFDVDWDVEPLGGGEYEAIPVSITILTLAPEAFVCPVCRLELRGFDELAEAGLPSAPMGVSASDLGPGFDVSYYTPDADW